MIYYFHDLDAPIYAVLVYGKGSQADLTSDQRKTASILVADLKHAIRDKRKIGGEA